MKAAVKPRTKEKGDAVRAAILTQAATPAGFAITGHNSAQYHCNVLIAAGLLHRAWVNMLHVRYFTTAKAAAQYLADNPWKSSRPERDRTAAGKVTAAKVAAHKIVTRTAKQQMQAVERKAYTPPAPRKDAVAVYPEHYRKTSRMMPPGRYEASVPFVRIGQAGFSMSI